jgi:hypothetical protein
VSSALQHTLSPPLKTAAIDTLGYFEFFQHALFVEEVHKYLSLPATLEEVNESLALLKDEGSVFEKQGLWALNPAAYSTSAEKRS